MAARTGGLVDLLAVSSVGFQLCGVGRRRLTIERIRLLPLRTHSAHQNVNLRVGKKASGGFGEGGHLRSGLAVGDDLLHGSVVNQNLIDGIGEVEGSAVGSVVAVASGAVLVV